MTGNPLATLSAPESPCEGLILHLPHLASADSPNAASAWGSCIPRGRHSSHRRLSQARPTSACSASRQHLRQRHQGQALGDGLLGEAPPAGQGLQAGLGGLPGASAPLAPGGQGAGPVGGPVMVHDRALEVVHVLGLQDDAQHAVGPPDGAGVPRPRPTQAHCAAAGRRTHASGRCAAGGTFKGCVHNRLCQGNIAVAGAGAAQ